MNDLVRKLDREATKLIDDLDEHPVAQALFAGTISVHDYAAYLDQTQHYVGAASELLRASGERLATTRRHPRLARLLIEKSEEESGHDGWARDDRRALGLDVPSSGPNIAVQAYISSHRFEAEMGSGAAFLGTAYVLEALSACRAPGTVRNLLARSRIPGIENAVTFLRAHGEADQGHIAELAAILCGLGDRADSDAIVRSARRTRTFFPGFFASRR